MAQNGEVRYLLVADNYKTWRTLDARDVDLLVNGPNSLASSWRLRQLRNQLNRDPEIIEVQRLNKLPPWERP